MGYKEAKQASDEDVNWVNTEEPGIILEDATYVANKPSNTYGKIYEFRKDGEKYVLTGKTQLNQLMLDVPLDSMVKIEYVGPKKSQKGKPMKVFKVWFDDGSDAVEEEKVE